MDFDRSYCANIILSCMSDMGQDFKTRGCTFIMFWFHAAVMVLQLNKIWKLPLQEKQWVSKSENYNFYVAFFLNYCSLSLSALLFWQSVQKVTIHWCAGKRHSIAFCTTKIPLLPSVNQSMQIASACLLGFSRTKQPGGNPCTLVLSQ